MKRTIEIELTPTPRELAEVFCAMEGQEQAEFFNHIFVESRSWSAPFDFQAHDISSCGVLTEGGRRIMSTIGEYSSEYFPEKS